MKSPVVLLLRSQLKDLQRLHPDVKGLDRDFHTIERRLEDEGFSFLSKTLSVLSQAILNGIETGQFTCPPNFRKIRRGSIPRLFSGMICEVFDSYTGRLIDSCDPAVVKSLQWILKFYKKTIVSSEPDSDLDSKAKREFFDLEDKLVEDIPQRDLFYIDFVSSVCLPYLETSVEDIPMKHGPGAVFEGYRGNQKWLHLWHTITEDSVLDEYGLRNIGLSEAIPSEEIASADITWQYPLDLRPQNASGSCARLHTVPKDSTSRRTITIEPLAKQFVQQGLNTLLRDNISRCKVLRGCLALDLQSKNQVLAYEGSLSNKYSTIDLKSASDLLSLTLVRRVFKTKPFFLEKLLGARSEYVLKDNVPVRIRKFGGMGNATTFPVQSIVFAIVSIASIMAGRNDSLSYRNVLRAARHVRCYGDDIIITRQHARQVVLGLTAVGLVVNTNKSFFDGRFKESCGTDWFKGELVTPLYLKYHPSLIAKETRALTNIVALSNSCWDSVYYDTSTILKEFVEKALGRVLPYVPRESGALGWHTRRGDVSYEKYDKSLHRWLTRAPVITVRKERSVLDGYPALLKFFHVPLLGRPKDHLEMSPIRYRTSVSMRWVAL